MIGTFWLNHIADVLAAASDEQLEAVRMQALVEQAKRSTMTKGGVKCRQKRATERVAKQLIQGIRIEGPKEGAAGEAENHTDDRIA